MSYCRFENTAIDLRDCQRNLPHRNLSKNEAHYFIQLIDICREIAEFYADYSDEDLMEIALDIDENQDENEY